MHSNNLAIVAALAAAASAFDCNGPYFSFYNRHGPAMSSQRLDPALFPGKQSPHMHDFDGGNALTPDVSFEGLQGSECTTARIKPDNSLYWRPALYWNGNGTGFYPVPNSFLKVYYKFGDNDNVKAKNISEFPEDFSMIAGDTFRRSEDEKNEAGIDWTCIAEDYSRITAKGFPTGFTSCGQGLTTQLTFPSCWNGNAINPAKPDAHMAYPTAGGSGIDACPKDFQAARFPAIFIEFWWDVSAFDGQYSANDNPWVLAQGDPTGFGMHADFKNGWKKGVLAKATSDDGYCNCGCGCGDDQMRQCFGVENVNNDADIANCSAKSVFPSETGVVQKLPGCNPIQDGPEEATMASGPDCTAVAPGAGNATSAVASATSAAASVISSAVSQAIGAVSNIVATIADVEPTAIPESSPESSPNATPATPSVSQSRHGHHQYHTTAPVDAESSECTSAATVTVTPPPVTVTVTATAAGGYAVDRRRRRQN
ncbi:hypothetical protein PMIN06_005215 [Paraphaeosphaeria minitans]|uniref:WSC domain-containing protein-like protein 6 n=1 Tax=Paraphaeosphaeria minitans TaxID=565426 RepID=A0A9P6GM50_9PLEO|nr:WSC domain-containing protein-like protein 6 [Paraphaeosphaeria minitans]